MVVLNTPFCEVPTFPPKVPQFSAKSLAMIHGLISQQIEREKQKDEAPPANAIPRKRVVFGVTNILEAFV